LPARSWFVIARASTRIGPVVKVRGNIFRLDPDYPLVAPHRDGIASALVLEERVADPQAHGVSIPRDVGDALI
jgi:hypothetical protein